MPSEKILEEKKVIVANLAEKIKNSAAGVFVDYQGLTVEEDTKLRRELRKAGVEYLSLIHIQMCIRDSYKAPFIYL